MKQLDKVRLVNFRNIPSGTEFIRGQDITLNAYAETIIRLTPNRYYKVDYCTAKLAISGESVNEDFFKSNPVVYIAVSDFTVNSEKLMSDNPRIYSGYNLYGYMPSSPDAFPEGRKIAESDAILFEIILAKRDRFSDIPRVGDFIRYADGSFRRFSADYIDGLQVSDDGSFYIGMGCVSFSGSLFPKVYRRNIKPTDEFKLGSVWTFSQGRAEAHNGTHTELPFRVFEYVESDSIPS